MAVSTSCTRRCSMVVCNIGFLLRTCSYCRICYHHFNAIINSPTTHPRFPLARLVALHYDLRYPICIPLRDPQMAIIIRPSLSTICMTFSEFHQQETVRPPYTVASLPPCYIASQISQHHTTITKSTALRKTTFYTAPHHVIGFLSARGPPLVVAKEVLESF